MKKEDRNQKEEDAGQKFSEEEMGIDLSGHLTQDKVTKLWFSHAEFSSWCNYSAIQLQVVLYQTSWLFMYSLGR